MKKSRIIPVLTAIFCLLAIVAGGCKPSPKKLAQENLAKMAKQINSHTPEKLKRGTLTEVKYEDNTFILCNELPADTLAALNKAKLEERTLDNLRDDMGKLMAKVIEADADIEYIYYNGTDSLRFSFTADELRKASE